MSDAKEVRDPTGRLQARAEHLNGKLHGRNQVWNDKGVLIEDSTFRDGVRNGSYQTWWDNGKPKESGEFRDGERVGKFTWYDDDGIIIQEHDYSAAKLSNR